MDAESSQERVEHISIAVNSPNTMVRGLHKYIEYTVIGRDQTGEFKTTRRYKDFAHLRSALGTHWPGCYIPGIPPKQSFGNLQQEFVETRRKQLEIFLMKLASLSFVYSSVVFQGFIRGDDLPFRKAFHLEKKYNIEAISSAYKSLFSEYLQSETTDEDNSYIHSSKTAFEAGLRYLLVLDSQCSRFAQAFSLYEKQGNSLFADYLKLNEEATLEISNRTSLANPGTALQDWIRAEILDVRAILHAIQQKNEFERIILRSEEDFKHTKHKLEDLKSGKKSLSERIMAKNIETLMERASDKAQRTEKLYCDLVETASIMRTRLAKRDIPGFTKRGACKFEKIMRLFSEITTQEYESFLSQFRSISQLIV